VLGEAIEVASVEGFPGVKANATLVRLLVRLRIGDPSGWRDEAAAEIADAIGVFEQVEDYSGLAKAWRLLAWTHGTACHFGKAAEASELALRHAHLAEDVRQQNRSATAYAAAAVFGPTSISEAIVRCEHMVEQVSGDRQSEGMLSALLASLLAMQGSLDRARELAAKGRAMLDELGLGVEAARAAVEVWRVEMLAGDPVAAEKELRHGYDLLVEVGEKYVLSTVAGLLGQTLYALGRYEEAEQPVRMAEELATADDVDTQSLWRCVRAKLLARDREFDEAEALVREALDILAPTDAVLLRFGALIDLAEVHRLAGREVDAHAALDEALRQAEVKGSPAMAAEVRAFRAKLVDESLVS
jgi:tetratricopeptide (TPR) repeat protein